MVRSKPSAEAPRLATARNGTAGVSPESPERKAGSRVASSFSFPSAAFTSNGVPNALQPV